MGATSGSGAKWKETFEKTFKNFILVHFSLSVFSISATLLDAFSIYLRHVIHYSFRQAVRGYNCHNCPDHVTIVCCLYICLYI